MLLTRGVCNIGKLNYYLGKRAHDERGEGKFPDIDFCANPEAICASKQGTEEMRWITGLFEWIDRIQSYPDWDYKQSLQQFVNDGMLDDSFIDTVSSIFTRGCHSSGCSDLEITMKEKRKENFKKVLDIFGLPELTAPPTMALPLPQPTPALPTQKPVTRSPVKGILPPSFSLNPPAPPPNNQNQNTNAAIPSEPTQSNENAGNIPLNPTIRGDINHDPSGNAENGVEMEINSCSHLTISGRIILFALSIHVLNVVR